jgi:DNA-binding Lrp family transcriptional regulator
MLPLQKKYDLSPSDISELLKIHYAELMPAFYESQSLFLRNIYKRHRSIEVASIALCFARNIHLEIIRQREKDLNFNISSEKFWENFSKIDKPLTKISSIAEITGIPKETVRRKIKNLLDAGYLAKNEKRKSYYWNPLPKEKKNEYSKIIGHDTKNLSKFIYKIVNHLQINLDNKIVEDEIHAQFSFYWYHYLSCQLAWLKLWQLKLKDNDLLLIALETIIPTLQYINKNMGVKKIDDVFKVIGKFDEKDKSQNCSVSATSICEITGIPRATCIRKLEKLMNLEFLTRSIKTKRYSISQASDRRTKGILFRESSSFTIKNFSEYIAIIINSLIHNKL